MLMILVFFTCVTVLANKMKPVVALKKTMVLDDPVVFFTDVGRKQRCSHFRMIGRPEQVANIVQECTDYCFIVSTVPFRTGCRL